MAAEQQFAVEGHTEKLNIGFLSDHGTIEAERRGWKGCLSSSHRHFLPLCRLKAWSSSREACSELKVAGDTSSARIRHYSVVSSAYDASWQSGETQSEISLTYLRKSVGPKMMPCCTSAWIGKCEEV